MMTMHSLWPRDREAMKDATIDRQSAARVWRFAHPYRGMVAGFLLTVILQAVLGLLPPILFGRIIDDVIPAKDRGLLGWYAFLIVAAAIGSGVVALFERVPRPILRALTAVLARPWLERRRTVRCHRNSHQSSRDQSTSLAA